MAWVYDRYAKRKALYQYQADARQNRLGLWSDPSPLPPWEYRRSRR
jgi:endonuclease YncB( thermonuclease family)